MQSTIEKFVATAAAQVKTVWSTAKTAAIVIAACGFVVGCIVH